MRFKIDENLHDDVAALLVADGHNVETVHSEGLRGCVDPVLAQHCASESRAIITLDWTSPTFAPSRRLQRLESLFCECMIKANRPYYA